MRRYGLRDEEWERIRELVPGRDGHVGVTARDNRLFVEAVLYRYRAGIPWRDLPERFGKNVHRRHSRWAGTGVWERVFKALSAAACNGNDRHHDRAGSSAQRRRPQKDRRAQAIGRSFGGLTTKILALVDALGRPTAHSCQRLRPIENFFANLKQFRAIATRYDKTAQNFLAGLHAAAIHIWLN